MSYPKSLPTSGRTFPRPSIPVFSILAIFMAALANQEVLEVQVVFTIL